jgi:hypothetical protein
MKHHIDPLRLPLLALLLAGMLLAACSSDEPDYMVGYYMDINSQVRLSLADADENQGTTPDMVVDVLSNTVRRMRQALRDAYPQDTRSGNDAAVLTAVDNIYRDYKLSYASKEGNTVCVINLYRTKKEGEVVKESMPLKTYHFGALPEDTTQVGN